MARFKQFTVQEIGAIRRALDEHAERVGWDRVPMEVLSLGAWLGDAVRVAGRAGDVALVLEVSPAVRLAPLFAPDEAEEGVAA